MNFALILFILVVFTGVAWVADKLMFQRQRQAAATAALAEFDARAQAQVQYGAVADVARRARSWPKRRCACPGGWNIRPVSSR